MIGPVFGHVQDNLARDQVKQTFDGEISDTNSQVSDKATIVKFNEIDRKKPLGILQLINKKDFQEITKYDKQKFEAIQGLIGLAIDNTSEQHSVLNIRLGIFERMR